MLALTLYQPWASLMARGLKMIETRSWPFPKRYKLPHFIAIHAAKRPFKQAQAQQLLREAGTTHWFMAFRELGPPATFPLGAIVAVARLRRCLPTVEATKAMLDEIGVNPLQEIAFGDFTRGRFAWWFDGIRGLARPVPYRGSQGLWNVPSAILHKVEKQVP